MTDLIAREPWLGAAWNRPVLPPAQRPIPRVDIDVEIDRRWHMAQFSTDPSCHEHHMREHNRLLAERAAARAAAEHGVAVP